MSTDIDFRRFVPADAAQVWRVHETALRAAPIESSTRALLGISTRIEARP